MPAIGKPYALKVAMTPALRYRIRRPRSFSAVRAEQWFRRRVDAARRAAGAAAHRGQVAPGRSDDALQVTAEVARESARRTAAPNPWAADATRTGQAWQSHRPEIRSAERRCDGGRGDRSSRTRAHRQARFGYRRVGYGFRVRPTQDDGVWPSAANRFGPVRLRSARRSRSTAASHSTLDRCRRLVRVLCGVERSGLTTRQVSWI